MPIKELSQKPEKVVAAVKLLYLVVAIGIIRTSMTVIRHVDVRSPHILIISKMLIYAASVFLIYQVSKGKNWARWILLAIIAIAFPLSVLPTFDALFHNPIHTLWGFLQLALYIAAMIFLFHRSSTQWLGAEKGSD